MDKAANNKSKRRMIKMAVVKRRPVPKSSDAQLEKYRQELMQREQEEQACNEIQEIDNQEYREQITDNNQESNNNYNLEMFQPALSKTITRSNLIAGVMSVVNSKSSKRIVLSKELMDKLNAPTKVAISFSEECIAIGRTLPNNNNQLIVKPIGKKGAIYSSGVVSEITDMYGLDFNNRTSITFSEVDYIEADVSTVAIINAKQIN